MDPVERPARTDAGDPPRGARRGDADLGGKLSPDQFGRYPNLEKILGVDLPVIVVLAEKTATLEEVLSLAEGTVMVFKKHSSDLLDILINNRRIGAGKTVKVGEHFGVHVREIGTPEELLTQLR